MAGVEWLRDLRVRARHLRRSCGIVSVCVEPKCLLHTCHLWHIGTSTVARIKLTFQTTTILGIVSASYSPGVTVREVMTRVEV